MTATRYREIEVSGTPFDMGQQLGEAARDEIRGFDEIALERVNKTVTVSRERAMAVADRCVSFVEEYSADMLAELRGVSDSSGVCLANLMLLQIRNQLQPEADAGCTSFSIAPASQAGLRTKVPPGIFLIASKSPALAKAANLTKVGWPLKAEAGT